jgi:hypothetical protein
MLVRDREIDLPYTIDGDIESVIIPELYRTSAVMFLHFDSTDRKFLFERRVDPNDALFGKLVIPAGKSENIGEVKFPVWALRWEQLEEYGFFPKSTVLLGEIFDSKRSINFTNFLTLDLLWGEIVNREPTKHELVWMPESEVFSGNSINPIFGLVTTQNILQSARLEMSHLGI